MLVRNTKDLGTLLRQRRRTRQLSQQALADAIGVSRHWVMDLERGKPTLEVGLVLRAITALGLTTDLRDADRTAEPRSAGTYSSMIDLEQVLSRARGRSLAIAQRPAPYMTKDANQPKTSATKPEPTLTKPEATATEQETTATEQETTATEQETTAANPETTAAKRPTREKDGSASDGRTEGSGR